MHRPDMLKRRPGRASVLALLLLLVAGGCRDASPARAGAQPATGWDWFRSGDFSLAQRAFEADLRQAAAESPARLQAQFGLATTWNLRRPGNNPALATTLYESIIAAAPRGDLAAWSWLALARMKAIQPPGKEAPRAEILQAYEEVISRFPRHAAGREAFLLQQAVRLSDPQPEDPARVLAALEAFVRDDPESPYRSTAWRLIAHCAHWLERPDLRLQALENAWTTSEFDPANPVPDGSLTCWQLATVAQFDAGDFATARRYYHLLIETYPTEQGTFLARQQLRRMDALEAQLRHEAALP